jgi:hypothetical protein
MSLVFRTCYDTPTTETFSRLVGGCTARQRTAEAEKLNEQLRKINASLRQQTRAGEYIGAGCWHDAAPVLFVVLFASLVAILNMSLVF